MIFKKSKEMKIELSKEDEIFLQSKESIKIVAEYPDVIAFDIYDDNTLIGFALLREYEKNKYFLWDYAIDTKYQNKGLGTKALMELIDYMRTEYSLKEMATTYIWGNDSARKLYEKVGFIETSVVDEDDIHEVNMELKV